MISSNDNLKLRLISIDYKRNNIFKTLELSHDKAPKDLNDNLISILKTKMRNKLIVYNQSKTALNDDKHIKLNSQDTTIFIYLLNNKYNSYIQINDVFYHIVNYEDVYDCLNCYLK